MSEMPRLRELAVLLQPKVTEGQRPVTHEAEFKHLAEELKKLGERVGVPSREMQLKLWALEDLLFTNKDK